MDGGAKTPTIATDKNVPSTPSSKIPPLSDRKIARKRSVSSNVSTTTVLVQEADGSVRIATTRYAKAAFIGEYNPAVGKIEQKRLLGNFAPVDNLSELRRIEQRRIKRDKKRHDRLPEIPPQVKPPIPTPPGAFADASSSSSVRYDAVR
jgi:hypothetical protein